MRRNHFANQEILTPNTKQLNKTTGKRVLSKAGKLLPLLGKNFQKTQFIGDLLSIAGSALAQAPAKPKLISVGWKRKLISVGRRCI
jgi:hypothetical protein